MGRFHQSMSWNSPTDSGSSHSSSPSHRATDPSDVENDLPSFSLLNCEKDSGSRDHFLGSAAWSQLKSHRSFFLPMHYTPSYAYPLIVWLHSDGFNENQIDHVMPHISLRNYVGVGIRGTKAADSMGHRFDWHASPAAIVTTHDAVAEAVDEAIERFSVNPERIVLAGYRRGGTMALRIAMRDPHRFAGAISVGGRMPQGAIRNVNELRARRLPMLWQWGVANSQFSDAELNSDCRSLLSLGGQVEVRKYPGDDEMDTVVLRDVDDWIMRRVISNTSVTDSDQWATSPTSYSSN